MSNTNFLESVADYLIKNSGQQLKEHVVVVPNIRAGLYLKKQIGKIAGKPVWSPKILSIQDFFHEQSYLKTEEKIPLIFELYKSFNEIDNSMFDSFDSFYPWGEIILSDFNDIDKNIADAKQIFSNITDIKEIEQQFTDIEDNLLEYIRNFWKELEDQNNSYSKQRFLNIWKKMYDVYRNFSKNLQEQNIAYEGLIERKVVESFSNNLFPEEKPLHYFAGFNVLSRAEELMFKYFKNHHNAVFFWQYDKNIVKDKYHEAFTFIRKYLSDFPNPDDFIYSSEIKPKNNFAVFSLPSNTAQVKYASEILKSEISNQDPDFENTGFIIPDEALLQPVLYSMPDKVKDLNVTMGFPVSFAPQAGIVKNLAKLQENFKNDSYYYKDVINVLDNPLINNLIKEQTKNIKSDIINKNIIRINKQYFDQFDSFTSLIFTPCKDVIDTGKYFSDVLKKIYDELNDNPELDFDKEIIYHLYRNINRFNEYLIKDKIYFRNRSTYLWLLLSMLNSISIAFSGEPMKGLQVMGMLETRLIDFKNIIILSMNEGIFPGESFKNSFIPYSLRKAFDLPTIEMQDAIHAYYFYRMIMEPDNVYLLYNTSAEGMNKGEKSRYIQQIKNETDWEISENSVNINTISDKKELKEVIKDKYSLSVLEKYQGRSPERAFSASQLNTYLNCSMAFYYSYILGLDEEEGVMEQIGYIEFGNILHRAMKLIYDPFKYSEVKKEDIEKILMNKEKIDKPILQAYKEEINDFSEINQKGLNAIGIQVAKDYAIRILKSDFDHAPFNYEGGEVLFQKNLIIDEEKQVNTLFRGTIDHLDIEGEKLRIIDYKTGKSKKDKIGELKDLFFREGNDSYDHFFQVMFYAWLIYGNNEKYKDKILRPALFYTQNNILTDQFKINKEDILDFKNILPDYEQYLKKLISEIIDKNTTFRMTDNNKLCINCPFSSLCF